MNVDQVELVIVVSWSNLLALFVSAFNEHWLVDVVRFRLSRGPGRSLFFVSSRAFLQIIDLRL